MKAKQNSPTAWTGIVARIPSPVALGIADRQRGLFSQSHARRPGGVVPPTLRHTAVENAYDPILRVVYCPTVRSLRNSGRSVRELRKT